MRLTSSLLGMGFDGEQGTDGSYFIGPGLIERDEPEPERLAAKLSCKVATLPRTDVLQLCKPQPRRRADFA